MATAYDASFLDYQETLDSGAKFLAFQHVKGSNYGMGKVTAVWSEEDSVAGGGGASDTLDFMKLPPGTIVVGGWLYAEGGLGADNVTAQLGVVYEDSDGTDDEDAFIDAFDIYDAATGSGKITGLPTGTHWKVGGDVEAFPYVVDGGWATVQLIASGALVTAKDCKLILYVILPA